MAERGPGAERSPPPLCLFSFLRLCASARCVAALFAILRAGEDERVRSRPLPAGRVRVVAGVVPASGSERAPDRGARPLDLLSAGPGRRRGPSTAAAADDRKGASEARRRKGPGREQRTGDAREVGKSGMLSGFSESGSWTRGVAPGRSLFRCAAPREPDAREPGVEARPAPTLLVTVSFSPPIVPRSFSPSLPHSRSPLLQSGRNAKRPAASRQNHTKERARAGRGAAHARVREIKGGTKCVRARRRAGRTWEGGVEGGRVGGAQSAGGKRRARRSEEKALREMSRGEPGRSSHWASASNKLQRPFRDALGSIAFESGHSDKSRIPPRQGKGSPRASLPARKGERTNRQGRRAARRPPSAEGPRPRRTILSALRGMLRLALRAAKPSARGKMEVRKCNQHQVAISRQLNTRNHRSLQNLSVLHGCRGKPPPTGRAVAGGPAVRAIADAARRRREMTSDTVLTMESRHEPTHVVPVGTNGMISSQVIATAAAAAAHRREGETRARCATNARSCSVATAAIPNASKPQGLPPARTPGRLGAAAAPRPRGRRTVVSGGQRAT